MRKQCIIFLTAPRRLKNNEGILSELNPWKNMNETDLMFSGFCAINQKNNKIAHKITTLSPVETGLKYLAKT